MASLRASFQDKDRYTDVLNEAYAQGRLDDAEFNARQNKLAQATTIAQLDRLIADLPAPEWKTNPGPAKPSHKPSRRQLLGLAGGGAAAVVLGFAGWRLWPSTSSDPRVPGKSPGSRKPGKSPDTEKAGGPLVVISDWLTENGYTQMYEARIRNLSDPDETVVQVPSKIRDGEYDTATASRRGPVKLESGGDVAGRQQISVDLLRSIDWSFVADESKRQLVDSTLDYAVLNQKALTIYMVAGKSGRRGAVEWNTEGTKIVKVYPA